MEILTISGVVLALTQIAKVTFGLSKRYIPVSALIISGLVIGAIAWVSKMPITGELVSQALISAFVAGGVWSNVKATFGV